MDVVQRVFETLLEIDLRGKAPPTFSLTPPPAARRLPGRALDARPPRLPERPRAPLTRNLGAVGSVRRSGARSAVPAARAGDGRARAGAHLPGADAPAVDAHARV